jgi:hypothetical protein
MYMAWLGGITESRDVLDQTVFVPTDKTTLSIHMGFHSQDTVCINDMANMFINDTRIAQIGLCNQSKWAPMPMYSQYEFDLQQWSGHSVLLTFFLTNDSANPSSWFIDTVKFMPTSVNTTIQNADFADSNLGAWVEESLSNGPRLGQFIANGVAKLGSVAPAHNRAVERISQYVTFPTDAKRLMFDYVPHSEELCGKSYDVLNVEVDGVLIGAVDICKTTPARTGSVDVSTFAGRRVRVSFFLITDYSQASEVLLDNVVISNSLNAISVPTVVPIP